MKNFLILFFLICATAITEVKSNEKAIFKNEFYETGLHKGRLKEIKTQINNTEEVAVKRFVYGEGFTEVYDPYDNKIVYRYAKEGHLLAIENYNEKRQLCRIERFFWSVIEGEYRIISNAVEDENGNFWTCRTYQYDKYGNVSKDTLYGDLTGLRAAPLLLQSNGMPIENNVDRYSIEYTYSENNRLILQEDNNGKTIRFSYYPHNQKVSSKFVCDNETILIREFYFYNEENQLIKTVVDDGISADFENLQGVTERRATYFTLKDGKFESFQETFFDFESQKEKPLLQPQKKKPSEPIYTYDSSNRPVRVEEKAPDGTLSTTSFLYDYLGHKIASIDTFGNKTCFEYDALGRVIKTTYPTVLDENDHPIQPTEEVKYNLLNQVTAIIDSYDYVVLKRYNIRGQPVDIVYSDNTRESCEYNLNGTLAKSIAKNGSYIIYNYDVMNRKIKTERFTKGGRLLYSTQTNYNAFHPISEIDEEGFSSCYHYDAAGRLIEVTKETTEGLKRTEYHYEPNGQLLYQKEWFGSGSDSYTKILNEDSSSETTIKILDSSETLLKESCPKTESPVRFLKTSTINKLNQTVSQTIETDSLGNQTINTFDALSRLESTLKKNSMGRLLMHKEFRYDRSGNKAKEINHVIIDGTEIKKITTCWLHGPNRRLEEVIENYGAPSQKRTIYHYNSFGQLNEIIKPDGVRLFYKYNSKQLLFKFWASDNSFNYTYRYDSKDRIKLVRDEIQQTVTRRFYNASNQIIKETLGNGLTLKNQYDLQDRRILLTLPDQSMVAYDYDALYLRKVSRLSPKKEILYTHQYQNYTLFGLLTQASMIGNLGNIDYDRDHLIRSISTSYWNEKISKYDASGNLLSLKIKDPAGAYSMNFKYNDDFQLEEEKGCYTHNYLSDSLNNRLSQNDEEFTYYENTLLSGNGMEFSYDANGNIIEKRTQAKTIKYTYDALNRLIKVLSPNDFAIQYTYDTFHRILCRTPFNWDKKNKEWIEEPTINFIYDGDNEIGTASQDNQILELRILGLGLGAEIGAAVALELNQKVYAPLHDHRGSVTCLIDINTQQVTEFYRFSAYGEEECFGQQLINPWRFSSKRIDPKTGLVHFGKREYDPKTGRWTTKDPLGYADGPNRYAYAMNNPMTRIDLYGLFSLTEAWQGAYNSIKSLISRFDHFLISQTSYKNCLPSDLNATIEETLGVNFLASMGYYDHSMESGVLGDHELSNVRVTFLNGILNLRSDCLMTAENLSQVHGGVNVHYVFRPTTGWTGDIMQAIMVKFGYVSPQAHLLANTWKELIAEMGGTQGSGSILHYAHSIGGADTLEATTLLTEEERKMIRVITLGSPTLAERDQLNITHYASRSDGVSLFVPIVFNPIDYLKGLFSTGNKVIFIDALWEGLLPFDHEIGNSTYRTLLEKLGKEFIEIYR